MIKTINGNYYHILACQQPQNIAYRIESWWRIESNNSTINLAKKLTTNRGKLLEYLGTTIDYGKIHFTGKKLS